MAKRKRAAKKVIRPKDKDGFLPQRTTADIAEKHMAMPDPEVPQERVALKSAGSNEQGKELFDFVLKGMVKPDKK